MTVDLPGVYAVGLPVLLYYVIKTYFRIRVVWDQFRSVTITFSSEIGPFIPVSVN